jgi:hypothetical protein
MPHGAPLRRPSFREASHRPPEATSSSVHSDRQGAPARRGTGRAGRRAGPRPVIRSAQPLDTLPRWENHGDYLRNADVVRRTEGGRCGRDQLHDGGQSARPLTGPLRASVVHRCGSRANGHRRRLFLRPLRTLGCASCIDCLIRQIGAATPGSTALRREGEAAASRLRSWPVASVAAGVAPPASTATEVRVLGSHRPRAVGALGERGEGRSIARRRRRRGGLGFGRHGGRWYGAFVERWVIPVRSLPCETSCGAAPTTSRRPASA